MTTLTTFSFLAFLIDNTDSVSGVIVKVLLASGAAGEPSVL
jgi:hypothetical protein